MISLRLPFSIAALLVPLAAYAENKETPDWVDVSAIFNARCVMCHSKVAGASKGLRLDDYSAALSGGERGVVLLPGDAAGSELVLRLRGESTPRMPFLSRPLPEHQIALIESWINAGMPNSGGVLKQ
ncbi:c-type cytochrome domain-containing protein [Marivita sp. XM-24bin2]|mgnify:CR=1 FL=1|jgi:hypothetical protein|uniref:c-type cytochrome domain-containing protein n=1 Tax=unclassified Marivita TaxID=2632480 RepID=UPI000D793E1C|nr:c-type cytochrome domain-containing protein [Marivita sp. XM-24bin2]MCR9110567.1 hypothetical protein [Paracoccaceae bacterium]PWL35394.1 MAG: hypothetical protein DCO97_09715 [Marivita sp. XM-24bin2]